MRTLAHATLLIIAVAPATATQQTHSSRAGHVATHNLNRRRRATPEFSEGLPPATTAQHHNSPPPQAASAPALAVATRRQTLTAFHSPSSRRRRQIPTNAGTNHCRRHTATPATRIQTSRTAAPRLVPSVHSSITPARSPQRPSSVTLLRRRPRLAHRRRPKPAAHLPSCRATTKDGRPSTTTSSSSPLPRWSRRPFPSASRTRGLGVVNTRTHH